MGYGPLSRDSGLPWTVPPVPWYSGLGRTVGYGSPKQGQWTPMDSPTCPMVQWDRTNSRLWEPSDGTVDSHGQSHLSHGTVGSHRILMADLDITRGLSFGVAVLAFASVQ